ncbi:MAG: anti-sigma-factor antagonist [Solirubrobacterales bacterium]|nr:anti-sigma-factor antagonist [Solirubrobacterales bacterium]
MPHRRHQGSVPVGLHVERFDESGVAVIRVDGELDGSNVARLRPAIDQATAAGLDVLIDLSDCAFIDSSGIAQLLRVAQLTRGQDRSFAVVVRPGSLAAHVLRIATGTVLPFFDSRPVALQAMRPAAPTDHGPTDHGSTDQRPAV